jgi:hypothetical protein
MAAAMPAAAVAATAAAVAAAVIECELAAAAGGGGGWPPSYKCRARAQTRVRARARRGFVRGRGIRARARGGCGSTGGGGRDEGTCSGGTAACAKAGHEPATTTAVDQSVRRAGATASAGAFGVAAHEGQPGSADTAASRYASGWVRVGGFGLGSGLRLVCKCRRMRCGLVLGVACYGRPGTGVPNSSGGRIDR